MERRWPRWNYFYSLRNWRYEGRKIEQRMKISNDVFHVNSKLAKRFTHRSNNKPSRTRDQNARRLSLKSNCALPLAATNGTGDCPTKGKGSRMLAWNFHFHFIRKGTACKSAATRIIACEKGLVRRATRHLAEHGAGRGNGEEQDRRGGEKRRHRRILIETSVHLIKNHCRAGMESRRRVHRRAFSILKFAARERNTFEAIIIILIYAQIIRFRVKKS